MDSISIIRHKDCCWKWDAAGCSPMGFGAGSANIAESANSARVRLRSTVDFEEV